MINLLDPNLTTELGILATSLILYVILKIDKRWRIKYLPAIFIITFGTTVLIRWIISFNINEQLPSSFLFLIFPACLALWILIIVIIHRLKIWWLAIVSLLFSLTFTLVLINGYYRFYPTVESVFNINSIDKLPVNHEVSLKFTSNSNTAFNNASLESSLLTLGQHTQGSVYKLTIPGTVSKFSPRESYVYVPAISNTPGKINLPVLVLSTGFPGLPSNWLGSGLQKTMDEFASQHNGITPLVFMVDNTGSLTNDTECVDSRRGNVETYLATDVPNYIKDHFEVATDPSHWGIGGLSMGGMCSVMIALRHPNIYHYFLDFGGEIGPETGSKENTILTLFNGSESAWAAHQPSLLLAKNNYKGMGGYFGVGKQDNRNVTDAADSLYQAAKNAGIESIYESIEGHHTFNVWQQSFKDSLPWISNRMGATQCGITCH